jgi:putative spermidine/putrescine transport system ATP-binding protein
VSVESTVTATSAARARGGAGQPGASIELVEVSKSFGAIVAIRDVNLTIEPGEFVTLLGPSGSGKTTTLNVISGFDKPTTGTLKVDGKDILGVPTHKRGMGMVFQQYALFPHMTVLQNVMFPLKQRKLDKRAAVEKAREALGTVHLGDYGNRKPSELSGGQQQRVALARAIVYEPRALLMDEPLGALDKKLRESLQLEIKRLHKEVGSTFVFVTHDQEEALALSDRIAVFNNGAIEQIGTAEDLYERPASLFVARFLGESSTFAGEFSTSGDVTTVTLEDGTVSANGRLESGARGAVVVRPERIVLRPRGEQVPSGWNAVSATVTEQVYLGMGRLLVLHRTGGDRVSVREPAGRWSAAAVGGEVLATWRAEDGVLLRDDVDSERIDT